MQFQQMLYVVETARCGSINKAASKLFVAQSTVSAAISDLEKSMGIEIFIRSNHGVRLSDEGMEFVNYITPILESKQRVEELYRKKQTRPPAHFSVSTQRYPFSVVAFRAFLRHRDKQPYVYRIWETDMYLAIDDVYSRQADLGVIFLSPGTEGFVKRMLSSRGLEFHKTVDVEARIYIRKNHPLACREAISLSEISHYPFLSYSSGSGEAVNVSEEVDLLEFKNLDRTIFISDRATAYNLLANTDAFSFGTGILPPGYVDERIVARPIKGVREPMTLGSVTRRGEWEQEDVALYIRCLRETLEGEENNEPGI